VAIYNQRGYIHLTTWPVKQFPWPGIEPVTFYNQREYIPTT